MLTNQQFERTRRLASSLAGIELVERHKELLSRRSRRLGIQDEPGVDALLSSAEKGEIAATRKLLSLLTTKFTGFFRHPQHFELAVQRAIHVVRQRGSARLWSAAAATGEEPYSLAMAMIEGFGQDDPPVCIIATDLDADALSTAKQGEYGELSLRPLGGARKYRFFSESLNSGRWILNPEVRSMVECRLVNLADGEWPEGPFDVIFCRNVLMYLEVRHRCAALQRIAALLAPGGVLMLDPTEHLGMAEHLFSACGDGVFSLRRDRAGAERQSLTTQRMIL